jgi:hypothetical protein
MAKPASLKYDRPFPQEEKNTVLNLYESGIGEEFIALQLDLAIPIVISILREHNIYKGDIQEKAN